MLFQSYQVVIVLASVLAISSSYTVVSAFDADCGDGYTGYSLKLGTQCRSYVYCTAGTISSTTDCPGSLIYDGSVGVGGVCGWPNSVTCADSAGGAVAAPTNTAAASSGESVGSVPLTIVNVDSDEANALAQLLNNNLSPAPPSANSIVIVPSPSPPTPQTPPMINSPTANGVAIGLTSYDTGYCGGSKMDAEAKCVPCVERMCNDFTEACWLDTSCNSSSSSNISQPSPPTAATYSVPSPTITTTETVETAAVSVPSKSTTLPPWTNAPFVPYRGPRLDKTVIGYYASWQWYDRVKFADPQNIDWSKYDRVNYAFFQIDEEGEIFGTDEWADPQLLFGPYLYDQSKQIQSGPGANYFCSWDGPGVRNCNYHDTSKGIVELAHKVQAEVYPSIGGWTLSDNFPTVAASERTRKNFAKNCVKLLLEYSEYIHIHHAVAHSKHLVAFSF
jgi:hypothetical protein